jgi:transcriptional regulator with XRE-family HTH domain
VGNLLRKPEKLPAKLLAIRHKLELSQSQMAKLLALQTGYPRISEYEIGKRESDLNNSAPLRKPAPCLAGRAC